MNQSMQGEGGAAAVRMEDLLAEAGWIRNLARSLVGDGQAADDVVQETWLAVLKKPPSGDRPLRPWLARVVTNFARMQRRGEASRRRREASVARSEALPSSAELVERVEVHKLLAGLVVTLDEPLRETVLLRYFAGLSSVEISKRTGTPAGTVRWRLKRGLEELRGALDRRHAGREGWVPALAALSRLPEVGPGSGAEAGAGPGGPALAPAAPSALAPATVVTAVVLALAALVALALVLGPRWLGGRARGVQVAATPAAPASAAGADGTRARPAGVEADTRRAERAVDEDESAGAHPFVSLRVVDQQGRPLAGATLLGAGGRSARTDASGLLALAQPPGSHQLRLEAEGRVPRIEYVHLVGPAPPGGTPLGTLALERAGTVEGRVVDEAGRPLADARVAIEEVGSRWMEAPGQPLEEARYLEGLLDRGAGPLAETSTDALGRFELGGLPPGFVRVWASAPGRLTSYSEAVGLAPGGVARPGPLALRAPRPFELVTGRVVDAAGRGVPGARLESGRRSLDPLLFQGQAYAAHAVCDHQGRFSLLVDPQARHDLAATDPDGVLLGRVHDVPGGTGDLRIELRPRGGLRLRALDGLGFETRLVDAHRGRPLELEVRGQGGPEQALVAPAMAFRLVLERDGHVPLELGPYPPDGPVEQIDVAFEPLAGRAGRVTHEGAPVAGAQVLVLAALRGPEEGAPLATLPQGVRDGAPFVTRVDPRPPRHRTSTDDQGRFRLPAGLDGGSDGAGYVLRVEAPEVERLAPALVGPLALRAAAAGEDAGELAIELDGGGTVTGRVELGSGVDPGGVVIGLAVGDGRLRSARADASGRFRFERVPAGTVQLRRLEGELRRAGWQLQRGRVVRVAPPLAGASFGGRLEPGGTLDVELDLSGARPTRVEGRFLIDGHPPGPWQVRLLPRPDAGEPDTRSRIASTVVGPDGSFALEGERGGAHVLELWNTGFEPLFCVVRDELELVAGGTRHVDVSYATGRLEGHVRQVNGAQVHHVWRGDASLEVTTRLEGDAEGRCDVRVPAGRGLLTVGTSAAREVDVDPGARLRFELP